MEQQRSQVFQVNCICCLPLWEGGGGHNACKIKRLTPTIWTFTGEKKQAFIFRETVGIYGRNGQTSLIPWGERNEGEV